MAKRALIVFFLFAAFAGVLGLQMIRIPLTLPLQAGSGRRGGMSIVVDSSRGAIYDRRGERLVQAQPLSYAAAKPTPAAAQALRAALSEQRWQAAEERLARGGLVALPVDTQLPPCEDIRLLQVYPRYAQRQKQLAAHLIGHLDGSGQGVSGLEKSLDGLLRDASGELSVRLASDALGRALTGAELELSDEGYRSRAGIQLTIDARVQRIAEEAMELHGLEPGAVVVLDAATSEILALASSPGFDPNNVAASLEDPGGPFLNRALQAYPIGSTFKCFVAAAALEQRIPATRRYGCEGMLDVGGRVFRCNREEGHGWPDLSGALEQSCNLYFIQLAQAMEPQPMLDLIASFGFGESQPLAPGYGGGSGNVPDAGALAVPGELANFSFGQGQLLGTPLQMAVATACLANGGVLRAPALIQATVDAAGEETPWPREGGERQVISPETAEALRQMMISAVEQGSGQSARPETGSAGGKTATAQSGTFDAFGQELLLTGFAGFFPAENPRYVISVLRQNGVSGAADCGPVFQRIANAMAAEGMTGE
ncbi:MAG: penicillin-binding protein 2 [Oscillospiraceae bacterium]|nr:penicillin-binding protein 2 [Oscillospiraceae bacterium]